VCRFESCSRHFFNPLDIMNELKEKLKALGLSEEMTDSTIATVADFVKSKIPESYHSMIDDVLDGKTPELGGILGSLGGFLGGK
jgi:ketopantoate reductase